MRSLLRGLALAALTVLLPAVLAAPAAAGGGEKALWGPIQLPDGESAFPVYEDLGVDVFQYQLTWATTAPTRPASPTDPADPAYKWPQRVQTAIDQAEAHGMTVALMVRQSPTWSGGGVTSGPSDTKDYADFLTAARRKYPKVDRWMIWGETNRRAVWDAGPVAYANLVDAAYGALKAPVTADPGSNVVVAGMTFAFGETAPAMWIDQLKRSNGQRPRFDEYGHNPFTHRCPDLSQGPNYLMDGARDISDIDTLREDVHAAFGAYKPLWLSEFTVGSDRPSWSFNWFVSRETQADWLARAFRLAGHVPGVSGLGWFNLVDGPEPDGLTFGLLDVNLQPKPSYGAYKAASMQDLGLPGPCPGSEPPPVQPPANPAPVAPPAAVPAPAPTAPADVSPPRIRITVARSMTVAALRKKLAFKLYSDEPATVSAELSVAAKAARRGGRTVIVRTGKKVSAGNVNVIARLSASAKRTLARQKGRKLGLTVTATDAAGNRSVKSATIKLRG